MIRVRVAEPNDAGAMATIYTPIARETAISFEIKAPSAAVIAERIEGTLPWLPWLVAAHDGQLLGYAYASQHRERAAYRWSIDVTAYVAEVSRRTGVGTRLYSVLIGILRIQGFRSAFAGIALPNPASVALHEKVGFKQLGVYEDVGFKLGRWHSVGWWRRGLATGDETPAEPTPFADIRGSEALNAILG